MNNPNPKKPTAKTSKPAAKPTAKAPKAPPTVPAPAVTPSSNTLKGSMQQHSGKTIGTLTIILVVLVIFLLGEHYRPGNENINAKVNTNTTAADEELKKELGDLKKSLKAIAEKPAPTPPKADPSDLEKKLRELKALEVDHSAPNPLVAKVEILEKQLAEMKQEKEKQPTPAPAQVAPPQSPAPQARKAEEQTDKRRVERQKDGTVKTDKYWNVHIGRSAVRVNNAQKNFGEIAAFKAHWNSVAKARLQPIAEKNQDITGPLTKIREEIATAAVQKFGNNPALPPVEGVLEVELVAN